MCLTFTFGRCLLSWFFLMATQLSSMTHGKQHNNSGILHYVIIIMPLNHHTCWVKLGHAVAGGLWAAASASFSTLKHATCKAFQAPGTFASVWTFRSHSDCDARAIETSSPSGEDWLRHVLWAFFWYSIALGAIFSKLPKLCQDTGCLQLC